MRMVCSFIGPPVCHVHHLLSGMFDTEAVDLMHSCVFMIKGFYSRSCMLLCTSALLVCVVINSIVVPDWKALYRVYQKEVNSLKNDSKLKSMKYKIN